MSNLKWNCAQAFTKNGIDENNNIKNVYNISIFKQLISEDTNKINVENSKLYYHIIQKLTI